MTYLPGVISGSGITPTSPAAPAVDTFQQESATQPGFLVVNMSLPGHATTDQEIGIYVSATGSAGDEISVALAKATADAAAANGQKENATVFLPAGYYWRWKRVTGALGTINFVRWFPLHTA